MSTVTQQGWAISPGEFLAGWWNVLNGRAPLLSIEITRECLQPIGPRTQRSGSENPRFWRQSKARATHTPHGSVFALCYVFPKDLPAIHGCTSGKVATEFAPAQQSANHPN
jgi:hypothetical protein